MFTKKQKKKIKERVNFVIDSVNLMLTIKPSEISGGMQKEWLLLGPLLTKPKYLFCDEPNSGLDPKQ
jgi:phospholipid/cholesterol/gamma-HCH transport system ATP-binding protein